MKARILEEVQHLPVEQRIELAEAIWDTVAEDADAAALPRGASVEDLLALGQNLCYTSCPQPTGAAGKEHHGTLRRLLRS